MLLISIHTVCLIISYEMFSLAPQNTRTINFKIEESGFSLPILYELRISALASRVCIWYNKEIHLLALYTFLFQ